MENQMLGGMGDSWGPCVNHYGDPRTPDGYEPTQKEIEAQALYDVLDGPFEFIDALGNAGEESQKAFVDLLTSIIYSTGSSVQKDLKAAVENIAIDYYTEGDIADKIEKEKEA